MRRSPPAPLRPARTVMVGKARPAQPDVVRRIDASLPLTLAAGGALRFTTALPASVTYSRSGPSSALTVAGAVAGPFGADVAPITDRGMLIEPARSNVQLRSDPLGAVVPSTLPDGWTTVMGLSNGVTRAIAAEGVDPATGLRCFDLSLAGTFTAQEAITVMAGTSVSGTPTVPGEVWSASMYWAVIAGSLPAPSFAGVNGARIRFGTPGLVAHSGSSDVPNASFGARQTNINRVAPATTTVVGSDWQWWFGAGQAINCTIRFGAFQLEVGAAASSYMANGATVVPRGLPSITTTVPAGRTIARVTYGLSDTVVDVTGLVPGASLDLVTGRPWVGLGNELKSLEWRT